MNSFVARSLVFAALLSAPLAGFGQVFHTQAGGGGTMRLTLLPGPTLTSISSGVGAAEVKVPTSDEIRDLEVQIRDAQLAALKANRKLQQLEEQRDFLRAKLKASTEKPALQGDKPIGGSNDSRPVDWLQFDFKTPPAPTHLPRSTPTLSPDLKFEQRF